MDPIGFARLVVQMRIAQRDYFRNRGEDRMRKSMDLEARVDEAARAIICQERQPSLFGEPSR